MFVTDSPKMSDLTTIRLGGTAIAILTPTSRNDLEYMDETVRRLGGTPFVLGKGSNIIPADGRLPYVLVRPLPWSNPIAKEADDGTVHVTVDASFPMPRLLAWAAKNGLQGLTALTGIPGEVGGAVRMNAGSYGTSIGDVLVNAEIFSPRSGLCIISRDDMDIHYRYTTFPHDGADVMIISATFALHRTNSATLHAASRDIMKRKRFSQPVHAKSAGCVFVNPEGESTGRILDMLGFRGKTLGGMAFSHIHANFLVNTGYGTSDQAFELIQQAKEAVKKALNIELSLEVRMLSC